MIPGIGEKIVNNFSCEVSSVRPVQESRCTMVPDEKKKKSGSLSVLVLITQTLRLEKQFQRFKTNERCLYYVVLQARQLFHENIAGVHPIISAPREIAAGNERHNSVRVLNTW